MPLKGPSTVSWTRAIERQILSVLRAKHLVQWRWAMRLLKGLYNKGCTKLFYCSNRFALKSISRKAAAGAVSNAGCLFYSNCYKIFKETANTLVIRNELLAIS